MGRTARGCLELGKGTGGTKKIGRKMGLGYKLAQGANINIL